MDAALAYVLLSFTFFLLLAVVAVPVWLLIRWLHARWLLFEKLEEPGWQALIPGLCQYRLGRRLADFQTALGYTAICGLFWTLLAALLLRIDWQAGLSGLRFLETVPLWLAAAAGTTALLVLAGTIWMDCALTRAFGAGNGMTVGLVLLPVVFVPVLGFGARTADGRLQPASDERLRAFPEERALQEACEHRPARDIRSLADVDLLVVSEHPNIPDPAGLSADAIPASEPIQSSVESIQMPV